MFNIGICYLDSKDKPYILTQARNWEKVFRSEGYNVFYYAIRPDQGDKPKEIEYKCREFILSYHLDLFIVEDLFSSSDTSFLADNILNAIQYTKVKTIAHHHNLWWNESYPKEPKDFPPVSRLIYHVALNTIDQKTLFRKRGIRAFIIPYMYDFEDPVPGKKGDEFVIFCPDIKGMDIEFAKRVEKVLEKRINLEKLGKKNFDFIISPSYEDLDKTDLMLYPAFWQGWGPYILEAIAKKVVIAISDYKVYKRDIAPFEFEFIPFDKPDMIPSFFENKRKRDRSLEKNIKIGRKCFSLDMLSKYIHKILREIKIGF